MGNGVDSDDKSKSHQDEDDIIKTKSAKDIIGQFTYYEDVHGFDEDELFDNIITELRDCFPNCADKIEDFVFELRRKSEFGQQRAAYLKLKFSEFERETREK